MACMLQAQCGRKTERGEKIKVEEDDPMPRCAESSKKRGAKLLCPQRRE